MVEPYHPKFQHTPGAGLGKLITTRLPRQQKKNILVAALNCKAGKEVKVVNPSEGKEVGSKNQWKTTTC